MIDQLIMGYRTEIYDWDISRWAAFCKENKKHVIGFGLFVVLIIISISACFILNSSLLLLLTLICEGIALIYADRKIAKEYQIFIANKQHHLSKVVVLLKNALPDTNLFGLEQIEQLILRLSKQIESTIPFANFLTSLSNFAKAIILPIITYIAGIFSSNLGKLDFETVAGWGISVVLLLGVVQFAWNGFSVVLRTVTCRNHDAAIAFREDLMDIKLMYFSDRKA